MAAPFILLVCNGNPMADGAMTPDKDRAGPVEPLEVAIHWRVAMSIHPDAKSARRP